MTRRFWLACVIAVAVATLVAGGCGGDDDDGDDNLSDATPRTLTLGGKTFNDRGTADVKGTTSVAVAAEDFAFAPTFIRGKAGQKVTLEITNNSANIHNFSLKAQDVDKDVAIGGTLTVDVTLPASGVLLYFCEYHTKEGMNGELIAGTGGPEAPPAE